MSAAWHFDRRTKLDEGADAMRDWIEMFGFAFSLQRRKRNGGRSSQTSKNACGRSCFVDGHWYLDYVRLRVQADFRPDLPRSSSALMCIAAFAPSAQPTITYCVSSAASPATNIPGQLLR